MEASRTSALSSVPESRCATLVSRHAALAALAMAMACAGMSAARAATVPVTVTINSVRNISTGDAFFGAPDFFARIWIDGAFLQTPMVPNSQGFVSPAGWTLTRSVSRAKRGGFAPVRIELWDFDRNEWFSDTMVDIDPGSCVASDPFGCADVSSGPQPVDSYGVDVKLNLFDGSWAGVAPNGDSNLGPPDGNPRIACTSGAGANSANVCFTITVGAPVAETLVVSKTVDSNRTFCAPRDCSLREASTLAESGDTVRLPASATPYELTLPGSAFPPPDPNQPWLEAGSHLRVRQNPLIVEGPISNGIAVIRQTLGDSRVFEVHPEAMLVMTRVSVTGGGAGNNSTAFFSHIHGGGIHNHGAIDLTHVTITGNRATSSESPSTGGGGGIYNADKANARLTNVTIADNSSVVATNGVPIGGGIAGPGVYTLRNTVIANNTIAGTQTISNCGWGTTLNIIDEGGNLQFPGNDCGRWVTLTNPRSGTQHTFWWPFIPAAGSNPLLPLLPQRFVFPPAPSAVDTGVAGCGPTDQAGRRAPADGDGNGVAVCDVGAIEHQ